MAGGGLWLVACSQRAHCQGGPRPGGLVAEEGLVSRVGHGWGSWPRGLMAPPHHRPRQPHLIHQAASHPGCPSAAPQTCLQRVQATGSEAFGTFGQNRWLTTQSINTAVSSQSKRKLGGVLGSNNFVHPSKRCHAPLAAVGPQPWSGAGVTRGQTCTHPQRGWGLGGWLLSLAPHAVPSLPGDLWEGSGRLQQEGWRVNISSST